MFTPRGGSGVDRGAIEPRSQLLVRAGRPTTRVIKDVIKDLTPVSVDALSAPTKTLRVAHFSDTYEPRRDGIITSLQTLVRAMATLGHEGLMVVPGHPDQDDSDQLLRMPSVPCGIAQFRIAAWPRRRHVEQIAAWRPDVIHVHTPGPVGLLGVFAARRLGVPLVQTYHTDLHAYADAYRLPSQMLSGLVRCYAKRLGVPRPPIPRGLPRSARRRALLDAGNYLLLGGADIVLVPTPAVLSRHGLPVDSERLFLAPSGVSLPPIPPGARQEVRARCGFGPNTPVALFVGRINREKNVQLLVDAFGRLAAQLPHARLLMVGAVYEQRWARSLLEDAGIADRCVLTGELPPAEVAKAYAAADVFAFPSRTDTQGLVLQEAALAGLPSVLVDPALHGSGPLAGLGVLTEPEPVTFGHAIAELLTDPVRRRRLGLAAKARAEQNTPAAYAARVAALYSRVVS